MYFVSTREEDDCKELYGGACEFFTDRETAFKAVRENCGDIHNDKYDVAWIECITPYLLAWATERVWFRWDEEKGGYCESEVPSCVDWPEAPSYPYSFL